MIKFIRDHGGVLCLGFSPILAFGFGILLGWGLTR